MKIAMALTLLLTTAAIGHADPDATPPEDVAEPMLLDEAVVEPMEADIEETDMEETKVEVIEPSSMIDYTVVEPTPEEMVE